MVKLEKVFIANVVLFVSDTKCLESIGNVNKKCFDALGMVRQYPYNLVYKSPVDMVRAIKTVSHVKRILHNLESISLPLHLLAVCGPVFEHLRLTHVYSLDDIPSFYGDKIVSLKMTLLKLSEIDLTNFINLKTVCLKCDEIPYVKLMKYHRYSLIKLITNTDNFCEQVTALKQYDIENIVIVYTSNVISNTSKSFLLKNPYIQMCMKGDIESLTEHVVYLQNKKKTFVFTHKFPVSSFESFYNTYLPHSVNYSSLAEYNKNGFNQITSLCSFSSNFLPKSVKQLTMSSPLFTFDIKNYTSLTAFSIENAKFAFSLPTNLIELTFIHCTPGIDMNENEIRGKPVNFNIYNLHRLKVFSNFATKCNFTSFKRLTNLTKISLHGSPLHIENANKVFPCGLIQLSIDQQTIPQKSYLQELTIISTQQCPHKLICHTELTKLLVNTIADKNAFPSSLQELHLKCVANCVKHLDLSGEPSLVKINISRCFGDLFILLPDDLETLYIENTKRCFVINRTPPTVECVVIVDSPFDASRINAKVLQKIRRQIDSL
ncbi:hypothetical protein EIN_370340 [Entamoeba invadens IP1]|uniref:Uncharacterized protein n=1 Tax=Entamoeba invadens IP1 TaxID=370355 RepID=A0A0A1UGI4_ENTIV|nr:hypothetical protein EIN_370340 [Entamoeba invadens IP1]ELP92682.1 hypothetical protein EIN_370340 [Entamoeba invadens IP1]|eukprot:XP_004259453.1 hypothetical protein EIN_370340 [Entamoeba invadens IP1]